ncbi:hypothetical protein [Luteimonas sp. R10]|uniref:hypothetical protein n=1 Tax=Luteimonas sp. R10 TaxID=3108176 RepID=UPI0030921ACB|nr:hypothetical protein U3649_03540 [Luteimonas sp. R10]
MNGNHLEDACLDWLSALGWTLPHSDGDAREVITVQQVYRRGELVWRGPRPYR